MIEWATGPPEAVAFSASDRFRFFDCQAFRGGFVFIYMFAVIPSRDI